MSQNKTFLNKVFIKAKPEGNYGPWYNMWIPNVEEFIAELQNHPTDAKGGLNFTISQQKGDSTKMSVTLDTYQSQSAPAPQKSTFQPKAGTAKPQGPAPVKKSNLPF